MWHAIISSPLVAGALSGLLSAAAVDYAAFRTWDDWHDLTSYSWGLATFRWVQGAIIGAIAALGVGALQ